MEAPADGQHSISKDDRGVKALDILRYQFNKVNDKKLSEYLRTYKRSGLSLPTAKFAGTGKSCSREYDQPVVTSRSELNSLLRCFKDK